MHKVMAGILVFVIAAFVASGLYGHFSADDSQVSAAVPVGNGPKPAPAGFAECLAKKGYVVYGASWCHYCKVQKLWLFGDENVTRPPYVECEPKGQPKNPACNGKPIDGYPTWVGPNGRPTEDNGAMSPQKLSQISGCPLK